MFLWKWHEVQAVLRKGIIHSSLRYGWHSWEDQILFAPCRLSPLCFVAGASPVGVRYERVALDYKRIDATNPSSEGLACH